MELAAPPSKQSRAGEGPKAALAQAQALSKAYSSLTSVLLALQQQRRKQEQDAHRSVTFLPHSMLHHCIGVPHWSLALDDLDGPHCIKSNHPLPAVSFFSYKISNIHKVSNIQGTAVSN